MLSISIAVIAFLIAAHAQPHASPAQNAPETVRRALMVGIENYPEATGWPQLSGPRADVLALRRAFIERAGFREQDIRVLFDAAATHAAILETFHELIEASQQDDVLVFYFAGHGSQVEDLDGDEADGMDETLVPFDAHNEDGTANDILDDQIAALIETANRSVEHVVLIMDCCSSGTNVRGSKPMTKRYVDPKVRGLEGTRGSLSVRRQIDSDYFPPSHDLSYVSMGACRANQSAHEYTVPGDLEQTTIHGLFTYCLVRQLYAMDAGMSYWDLGDRLRRDVIALNPLQTPVVEGTLAGRNIFSGGAVTLERYFVVEKAGRGWRLNGGRIDGLSPAAVFHVCEEGAT